MPGNIIFCNSTGLRRTVVFLFVFCIIQFSSAWIYPASSFSGIGSAVQEKFLGVPFQYCLWLVVSLCFYLDSRRGGLTFYSRVLLPIFPFILIGFASSIFGVMPFDSLRYLILFLVMCVSSVLPVSVLPSSVMEKYFFNIFSGIVVISLIYGVAFPDYGVQAYGVQRALRGFFTNKNQFGWFSAISLIIIVVFFDVERKAKSIIYILLAVAALLFADSKGALVSAVVALFFVPVLFFFQRKISLGLGVFVFILIFALCSVLGYFFFTDVLLLLGRDVTLTGRTVIWGMYFKSMILTPILGSGPGSYTSLSEVTWPIAYRLQEMGAILTPHNVYLAVFGESGVLGLICFIYLIFYFGFFQYYLFPNKYSLACSSVAILFIIGGFSETHEVFSPGITMFTLIGLRALAVKSSITTVV